MSLWAEDILFDINTAIKLIENQFESIKITDIFLIGSGFDNNVYSVNNEYLFRFPRREIANNFIKKEGRILPIINQYVDIPIPNPQFYGTPTEEYPYFFLGYNFLQGYSVEEISDINGVCSINILAEFLAKLHSIPVKKVIEIVGYDDLDRVNVEKRKKILIKNAEVLNGLDIYDISLLKAYIHSLHDICSHDKEVLVHGDLHIRNLLYDINGVASAAIDFGDAHVGNRACDLAIVYSIIPAKSRRVFWEKYGEVSQETLKLAQFRSIFTSIYLLLHAHDLGNHKLIQKAMQSLNNALEPKGQFF